MESMQRARFRAENRLVFLPGVEPGSAEFETAASASCARGRWSPRSDSNRDPYGLNVVRLPLRHGAMVPSGGFEPPLSALSTPFLCQLEYGGMVLQEGLEPSPHRLRAGDAAVTPLKDGAAIGIRTRTGALPRHCAAVTTMATFGAEHRIRTGTCSLEGFYAAVEH